MMFSKSHEVSLAMRAFALVGLVSLTLASIGWAEDKKPSDLEAISGKWEAQKVQYNGKDAPDGEAGKASLEVDGKNGTMSFTLPIGVKQFRFKLLSDKKPAQIELTATEGKFKDQAGLGIYKLEDKKLVLCLPNGPGKEAPKEFKSEEGSRLMLMVLARPKKEDKDEKEEKK